MYSSDINTMTGNTQSRYTHNPFARQQRSRLNIGRVGRREEADGLSRTCKNTISSARPSPSKRAAIIDVPSLAPPRFSLLPRFSGESRSKFVTAMQHDGRVKDSRDFSAARRSDFLRPARPSPAVAGKTQSRFRRAARVTTAVRARVSKNAV